MDFLPEAFFVGRVGKALGDRLRNVNAEEAPTDVYLAS